MSNNDLMPTNMSVIAVEMEQTGEKSLLLPKWSSQSHKNLAYNLHKNVVVIVTCNRNIRAILLTPPRPPRRHP